LTFRARLPGRTPSRLKGRLHLEIDRIEINKQISGIGTIEGSCIDQSLHIGMYFKGQTTIIGASDRYQRTTLITKKLCHLGQHRRNPCRTGGDNRQIGARWRVEIADRNSVNFRI